MVGVDETEEQMLECFRTCVDELGYYDDIKTMSIEDLKKFYFDIATPIKQMLNGFGFNMLSFGFETADELAKEVELKELNDSKCARFIIAYDYNGNDCVTAYTPFTSMIVNPTWTEQERLEIQRKLVMGFYNGFMYQYNQHHTKEEFDKTATEILTRIGLDEETIKNKLNPKE